MRYPPGVRLHALPLLLAAAPALGCINTDTAIFVDPTFQSPSVQVSTTNALGVGLNGSFGLDLHLGPRAAGPATVSSPEFSLKDPTTNADFVSPLLATANQTVPVTVAQGTDVVIQFTFETGAMLLPKSDATALCPPAQVVLGGVFMDSLQGGTTPFSTAAFQATCN